MYNSRQFKVGLLLVVFFSLICLEWVTPTHASPFTGNHTQVMDVKVTGLNVRSGPGTSYPVIAQVSLGEDLVNYCPNGASGCPPTSGNGFEWEQNYYPDGSIGYYANAAKGYTAWMQVGGGGTWNYNTTETAKVKRDNRIFTSACPNLDGTIGATLAGGYQAGYDGEIRASVCNPNAWTIFDVDTFITGYANGWNLNAQ